MREATIVYPHQLFKSHPALKKDRTVYLVEEPLLLNEFPVHRQKLLLHRLSLRAFHEELVKSGYLVIYLSLTDISNSEAVFERLSKDKIEKVHVVDVTDDWLSRRISEGCERYHIELEVYESPLFLLQKSDAILRYKNSGKHMARFYKQLRIDKKILVTKEGEPLGGQWSFDEQNRQPLKKDIDLPEDLTTYEDAAVAEAKEWLTKLKGDFYGEAKQWLPYTHEAAEAWLEDFLEHKFSCFGPYEDAISDTHTILFHSGLAPLINIGLLTPAYVLERVLVFADKQAVPLNSVEGFVRQILGWREFIRASYECDGRQMRTKNFWGHKKKLPATFWTGETELLPVDSAVKKALAFGYTHHIERLMVLGNIMLLTQTDPDQVYRWFMAMYVDAYDWVMVPNVYGMSQFADGGLFATKPYISGGNYIKKMSRHSKGEWEEVWTGLYWNFINENKEFFASNHRLSMMPRLLEKMEQTKKERLLSVAKNYLNK